MLTETSKADLRVKVVRFPRNFGHQAALLAGDELVQGDVIVSLDTDLQYLPELFEKVEHLRAIETLDEAYASGIRYYDTAPWYGHGLSTPRRKLVMMPK